MKRRVLGDRGGDGSRGKTGTDDVGSIVAWGNEEGGILLSIEPLNRHRRKHLSRGSGSRLPLFVAHRTSPVGLVDAVDVVDVHVLLPRAERVARAA